MRIIADHNNTRQVARAFAGELLASLIRTRSFEQVLTQHGRIVLELVRTRVEQGYDVREREIDQVANDRIILQFTSVTLLEITPFGGVLMEPSPEPFHGSDLP